MDRLEQEAVALAAEAEALLTATGLRDVLARFGPGEVTGSLRYGLMTWRDIDIHVPVEPQRRAVWAGLLGDVVAALERGGARLHQAQYLDDYVDPHPLGAGLYWGLQVRTQADARWKLDLWGWEPSDFVARRARDAALIRELETADRGLILRLKAEARARGAYGQTIHSMDVYRFVIAGAGRDLASLEEWVARREA
jgi:hypothetical protein